MEAGRHWFTIAVGAVLVGGAAATGSPWWSAAATSLALVTGITAILVRRPARPRAWWLLMVSVAATTLARLFEATKIETTYFAAAGSPLGDIRALIN